MTIGVIGQGYVGTAIKLGFQDHYNVITYDKFDLAKSTHSKISDLVEETKVIYETLLSTVGAQGMKRNKVREPESLNEAVSRRSSTRLSVTKEETKVDPSIERMKKLAGID